MSAKDLQRQSCTCVFAIMDSLLGEMEKRYFRMTREMTSVEFLSDLQRVVRGCLLTEASKGSITQAWGVSVNEAQLSLRAFLRVDIEGPAIELNFSLVKQPLPQIKITPRVDGIEVMIPHTLRSRATTWNTPSDSIEQAKWLGQVLRGSASVHTEVLLTPRILIDKLMSLGEANMDKPIVMDAEEPYRRFTLDANSLQMTVGMLKIDSYYTEHPTTEIDGVFIEFS